MSYKKIPQNIPHWWMVWFWEANFHWNFNTGCLEYNSPLKRGYPRVNLGSETFAAHRIAYFLYYEHDPCELLVRHLCHNHNCCNPRHLTLGTHWDNSQDMVKAGRSQKGDAHWMKRRPDLLEEWRKTAKGRFNLPENGEKHPATKLTTEKVRAIKAHSKMGASNKDLAAAFGVTHSNISAIVLGKSWKHIKIEPRPEDDRWKQKLTEADVREIRHRANGGESQVSILKDFAVGDSAISAIIQRQTWKHVE